MLRISEISLPPEAGTDALRVAAECDLALAKDLYNGNITLGAYLSRTGHGQMKEALNVKDGGDWIHRQDDRGIWRWEWTEAGIPGMKSRGKAFLDGLKERFGL